MINIPQTILRPWTYPALSLGETARCRARLPETDGKVQNSSIQMSQFLTSAYQSLS
jgi:hypothetical protein